MIEKNLNYAPIQVPDSQRERTVSKYHYVEKSLPEVRATIDRLCSEILARIRARFPNLSATEKEGIEYMVDFFLCEVYPNALYYGSYRVRGNKDEQFKQAKALHENDPEHYEAIPIIVDLEISDSGFKISVKDQGNGFNPKTLPDYKADENLLRVGGRGLQMIDDLNGKIEAGFEPLQIANSAELGNGNHGMIVTLEKKFKKTGN